MITKLEFLKLVEGNEYHPYVPPTGRSGVTIGIGVDLGNIGVRNLDVSDKLLEKLLPFDGLRGPAAVDVLDATPLRLAREEVDLLSMAAIELHEKELASQFDQESSVRYKDLEVNKKTVLLSVKYQYGSLKRRTPKFWGFAVKGDWRAVYNELMNFGDDYPTRREKEAALLIQGETSCSRNYLQELMNLESKHKRLVGIVRCPQSRDSKK